MNGERVGWCGLLSLGLYVTCYLRTVEGRREGEDMEPCTLRWDKAAVRGHYTL